MMNDKLTPIDIICTFDWADSAWIRTVEFDDGAELQ